jgi:hypothetical protein
MHALRRLLLLPLLLVVAGIAAACEPTAAALPRLTDVDEILEETLRTTAELKYVHARVEVEAALGQGIGDGSYVVDADIDLGRRELHAEAATDVAVMGTQRMRVLIVGSDMYVRVSDTERWQRQPIEPGTDPRAAIPPNPAIAAAIQTILEDPSVRAELRGMEACGSGECYHVVATIAPELIGRMINGEFLGAPPGQTAGPVDPAIPEVPLDILIDERTRRLVSVSSVVSVQGATADVEITLSNHDVELRIVPPPPGEVDESVSNEGGGFTEEQILDSVGEEIEGDGN